MVEYKSQALMYNFYMLVTNVVLLEEEGSTNNNDNEMAREIIQDATVKDGSNKILYQDVAFKINAGMPWMSDFWKNA